MRYPLSLTILSTVFFTSCVTNNPREGGFIGGIVGLSSGAYDERINKRTESLNRLQNIQQELQVNNANLKQQKQVESSKVRRLNSQVISIENDIKILKNSLAALKKNGKNSRNGAVDIGKKINRIENGISMQKQNLSRVQSSNNDGAEVKKIEENIRKLEKELAAESKRASLLMQ